MSERASENTGDIRICERTGIRVGVCVRHASIHIYARDEFGARRKENEESAGRRTRGSYRKGVRTGEGGRGEERETGAGERERDVAKQRPSPISILIELNATSYLMPETRQKLQLNGDAISLYLPVHSS